MIEVLLAIAVGSMLLALSTQLVVQIRDGWIRSNELDGQLEQVRLAATVLPRLLASAVPRSKRGVADGLQGSSSSVEFRAIPPQSAMELGRVRVKLFSESDDNGGFRLLLSISNNHGQPIGKPARWPIAENLRDVKFSYADAEGRFTPSWSPDEARLPELVRIVAHSRDGPTLNISVRPRVRVPFDCVIDSVSLSCRG
ncbi:hypothetical protein G3580_18285 [Nitrogeniibacter mangrovi]|uniref:General secretion pathway protein GspJ n=1 Tax=Nitrogeniibacter mangrovi TaxID=2016596 RepID=A0A6C1B6M3_9RHOO|nr:hypothetical protein G3580_18285 [Nitrogeniibacter mangrovi]